MRKKKRWLLVGGMLVLLVLLTACGSGKVDANSTGIWDKYIVFNFARAIKAMSFGNSGIGIILFTIIVRIFLLPLMHYQNKSMRKMQEIQPQLKELQEKYSSKDVETQNKFREEQQRLYQENNVNMYAGCLPLLIQMPVMMALYQAIQRTDLSSGHFLWMDLGSKDPYFILPILAAVFTFASSMLSMMSQVEKNSTTTIMTYGMPIFIFFMAINLPTGLSLYWVISNAFQVMQTLLINNPFKIRREREETQKRRRELEKAYEKAKNPKKKKNKHK